MRIKICYKNEIHILHEIPQTYEELIDQIKIIFKDQLLYDFSLYYIDFEEDKIFITSTSDLQLFLNDCNDDQEKNEKSQKIYIAEDNYSILKKENEEKKVQIPENEQQNQKIENNEKQNIIHTGYRCDGCGMEPIVGIRYQCSVCKNFDYCENCEENIYHIHPFLKIKQPSQNPKFLFTIINDEDQNDQKKKWQPKEMFQGFASTIEDRFQSILEKIHLSKKYKLQIIGQTQILPNLITNKTKEIYISMEIKNTGKQNLPNIKIECKSQQIVNYIPFVFIIFIQAQIPLLEAGQSFSLTIRLPLIKNQLGNVTYDLLFTYVEKEKKKNILKYPLNILILNEEQEKQLIDKAQKLAEITNYDLQKCLKFAKMHEDLNIDELINEIYE